MNNTTTIARIGWNAPSCQRSTLQLLYSCLSTIFLCTVGHYVLESKVPDQVNSWPQWTVFHDEVYYHNRIYRRMWWMAVGIGAPEVFMVSKSSQIWLGMNWETISKGYREVSEAYMLEKQSHDSQYWVFIQVSPLKIRQSRGNTDFWMLSSYEHCGNISRLATWPTCSWSKDGGQ